MNIKEKLAVLKAQKEIKKKEIELKQAEMSSIDTQIFNLEWIEISWVDLEIWVKENGHKSNYDRNPIIGNRNGNDTYCLLTERGELQVGPYYHNDIFPRGKPVLVKYDFERYRK